MVKGLNAEQQNIWQWSDNLNCSHLDEVAGSAGYPFDFYPNQCCQCFGIYINEKSRVCLCCLMEGEAVSEFNLFQFLFDDILFSDKTENQGHLFKTPHNTVSST